MIDPWESFKLMCFPDNTKSPTYDDKVKIMQRFTLCTLHYLRNDFQFYQYITYENIFTDLFASTETAEQFYASIKQQD